jgi:hypothetical protein
MCLEIGDIIQVREAIDGMNTLSEILMRGRRETEDAHEKARRYEVEISEENQERMVNDFEELMSDFEGDKIRPEKIAEMFLLKIQFCCCWCNVEISGPVEVNFSV